MRVRLIFLGSTQPVPLNTDAISCLDGIMISTHGISSKRTRHPLPKPACDPRGLHENILRMLCDPGDNCLMAVSSLCLALLIHCFIGVAPPPSRLIGAQQSLRVPGSSDMAGVVTEGSTR